MVNLMFISLSSRRRQAIRLTLVTSILFASCVLQACNDTTSLSLSSRSEPAGAPAPSSYAQFTDVPIPAGAAMDLERTIVLGDKESWIGRVVYTTELNPSRAYDFVFTEMPRFGWSAVSTVRAATSVLTYTRTGRAATIQIGGRALGGASVSMTVSPRGNNTSNFNTQNSDPVQIRPLK